MRLNKLQERQQQKVVLPCHAMFITFTTPSKI